MNSQQSREELENKIGQALSLRLDIPIEHYQKHKEREADSTTSISKYLAIPHIVLDDSEGFEILVVRYQKGVKFSDEMDKIKIVFALAGGKGERNLHLQVLMAIAQITQCSEFVDR